MRLYALLKKISDRINALIDRANALEAPQKALWSNNGWYMNENQVINLPETISSQKNGIVLVWSDYTSGVGNNYHFNTTFIPKEFVKQFPGCGIVCPLFSLNFSNTAAKYVYVSDAKIVGNAHNTDSGTANGITYNSKKFALRKVIGV